MDNIKDAIVFHAGLKKENEQYITDGGRVLAMTGQAKTLKKALKKSYSNIEKIKFENSYFRKDIGRDVV